MERIPSRQQWLRRFDKVLEARSAAAVLSLTCAGVAVIGVVDYFSGPDLAFSIFYLLPIYAAVARGRTRAGIAVSLLSAATWAAAEYLNRAGHPVPWVLAWNSSVRLGFFLVFTLLLASLRAEIVRERELASTDTMTGLLNVRAFDERVKEELARCRRYRSTFSLAFLDLDNFKQVNDRFGHSTGDQVLRSVAQSMRSTLRDTDSAARLGGDEFAILMPETGCPAVRVVMERMRQLLLRRTLQNGCPVTCSVGVATFSEAPAQVDEVLRAADEAMYRAKRAGKDTLVCRENP